MASDRKRQQATNPCLELQNKDRSLSLPLTHSCYPSHCQSLSPSTQTAASPLLSCLHTRLETHTHTDCGPYGEAWLLPLSPRLSPLSAPGRGGRINVPPNRFKNALYSLTLSLAPHFLFCSPPVVVKHHMSGLNEAYP